MHARIARLVYAATDPKTGACGSVINLFADARLNFHTKVESGLRAEEASQLIRQFFVERRVSNA